MFLTFVVYYESIKRKLKIKPIYECRCNGRLQTKRFTRLAHTGLVVELKPLRHFAATVCSRSTHSDRWTFGPRGSSTPETNATEGVLRASPSVWRGGYRRYIQRGSRQRAPKALCSDRLLTQYTQWPVDF